VRIALYHGYELTGSGSNEYCRYLSRALARLGHEVHVLCREPHPERLEALPNLTIHRLPDGDVRPVYLTDKQRDGNVKAFHALSDAELDAYHELNVNAVGRILNQHPVDILHANHLVYQPCVAAELDVPYVVFPHGSSIDERLWQLAVHVLKKARGLITGRHEMTKRTALLYPGESFVAELVPVGVDTALFAPQGRDSWRVLGGPYEGKGGNEEMLARLDHGDFGAVTEYRDNYDRKLPDKDLAKKLAAIPWEKNRTLLFVGALTAGKGLHNLIAALPHVPDTRLIIVGSGGYREVLEALVHAITTNNQPLFDHLAQHGFTLDDSDLTGGWKSIGGPVPHDPTLAARVHFAGRLNHDKLRHLFPCADLAVFPSVVPEAYPLVLLESLANEVLPVVSDFSGFKDGLDMLEPLLGKATVDAMRLPMHPAGIAERLNALLDAPKATGLREIAIKHFDWSVIAQRMVGAYERLLAPLAKPS